MLTVFDSQYLLGVVEAGTQATVKLKGFTIKVHTLRRQLEALNMEDAAYREATSM